MTTLNRTASNWSAQERAKINENWEILERGVSQQNNQNNGLLTIVEEAKTKSESALSNANQANNNATLANQKAEEVQSQLDRVVADGDSNAEVVQARGENVNLRARLDTDFDILNTDLQDTKGDIVNNANKLFSLEIATRYIAHRGASLLAPENTIPAYELASKLGFWGAECDIIYTLDGTWVLMHDDTVDRTTDGTGRVVDMTLAQIQALNIDGGNNAALYPNLKVPTLDEYLQTCSIYNIVPVIEIKLASPDAAYDKLISSIRRYGFEDTALVISFVYGALTAMRQRSKRLILQHLVNDIDFVQINGVRDLGNAGLNCAYTALTTNKVQLAHSNGIKVAAHTVNSLTAAEDLLRNGVDFITSDFLVGGNK